MENTGNTPFVDFGDVLRYYRTKAKLSQEQLAEGICTRVYVSEIEKNKQIPTLYMISAFSNKMGINLFDAYGLIIEHNDFDTHNKIELLNEAIHDCDDKRVYELAKEYAALCESENAKLASENKVLTERIGALQDECEKQAEALKSTESDS